MCLIYEIVMKQTYFSSFGWILWMKTFSYKSFSPRELYIYTVFIVLNWMCWNIENWKIEKLNSNFNFVHRSDVLCSRLSNSSKCNGYILKELIYMFHNFFLFILFFSFVCDFLIMWKYATKANLWSNIRNLIIVEVKSLSLVRESSFLRFLFFYSAFFPFPINFFFSLYTVCIFFCSSKWISA